MKMVEKNKFKLIQIIFSFFFIYNTDFSNLLQYTDSTREKYIILQMWNTLFVILNADILSLPLTVKKKSLKAIKENLSVLWRKQKSVTPLYCNRQGTG